MNKYRAGKDGGFIYCWKFPNLIDFKMVALIAVAMNPFSGSLK